MGIKEFEPPCLFLFTWSIDDAMDGLVMRLIRVSIATNSTLDASSYPLTNAFRRLVHPIQHNSVQEEEKSTTRSRVEKKLLGRADEVEIPSQELPRHVISHRNVWKCNASNAPQEKKQWKKTMADEVERSLKAKERVESEDYEDEVVTTFDKVVRKELPANIVYEDQRAVAFRDISPVASTHILIVPKKRDGLTRLSNAEDRHESILGHLLLVGTKVAKQEGLQEGYRLVINDGPHGCQSVYHLHVHLIGGKQLGWPPGV